jgi:glycosyltransferase involved in cell wall biosynthesis
MFEDRIRPAAIRRHFVVATPGRSVCDNYARALEKEELLRFIALGTRRGTSDVPSERTRLNPSIGLLTYAAAKTLSPFAAESFRFRLLPWFDRWVLKHLHSSDHIISSYGYANECFKFVRAHGGKTFVDAGNSHPQNFWETISEEHRRWKCSQPPVSPFWHRRSMSMLEDVDFVLSPSSFVTRSFLERGFAPERILKTVYPVDLTSFQPATTERPHKRLLTVTSTGSLSLRKGSPYLLEAFRIVRKSVPDARLLLTRVVEGSMKDILPKYSDLNIEWSPPLAHPQLAERLRGADIFVLPSLEEGLARTGIEALACGLPIVVTPNTGINDWITPGQNGEVVPIRDPQAIADAILKWSDRVRSTAPRQSMLPRPEEFSFAHFKENFIDQLYEKGIVRERS